MFSLGLLVRELREGAGVRSNREILAAARVFAHSVADIWNGDDAAAIPDPDGGDTLLAAEGMQSSLVQREPWFAGLCVVLCHVNDIAAMGGRTRALVDVILITSFDARPGQVILACVDLGGQFRADQPHFDG